MLPTSKALTLGATRYETFLSVDPGVHYFAWAYFFEAELHSCGLDTDSRYLAQKWPGVDVCMVEKPQVHRGQEKKKKDVVDLAWAGGIIVGQFPVRIEVLLSNLPKPIFQARARAALLPSELALVLRHKKADQKHIWDAVGFGIRYLGRK